MAIGSGNEPLSQDDIDAALAAAQAAAVADLAHFADDNPAAGEDEIPSTAPPPSPTATAAAATAAARSTVAASPTAPSPIFAPIDGDYATEYDARAPRNLNIVLDVPLEVSVELGRRRMSIRDILDLNAGSVIELDKIAGEPVDLLVNGRMVARGEVVVIEDNFGVRITEIVGAAAEDKNGDAS